MALPLSATHIPRFEALICIIDTALVLLSSTVAFVLFTRFLAAGSNSLLALACGFLLVTLTTLPQLLRASRSGFIDPKLHFITYLALPVAVIAYALLGSDKPASSSSDRPLLARAVAATLGVAAFATWLTAAIQPALPFGAVSPADKSWHAFASTLSVAACVAAILLVQRRRASMLDLWLRVAMIAWLIEVLREAPALDGVSFAWHLAQLYGVFGAACVTMALLAENASLYARVAGALSARDRPREEARDGRRIANDAAIDALADQINQPLFAITANVDAITRLLQRQPQDLQEIHAALADISSDALRASDTMRTAQRLLNGANESLSMVDIGQLVDECLGQLRTELMVQRVTCKVETAAQLPGIRGFRRQLLQLLTNLVTNSLEAMSGVQPGERRLRVCASRHDARAVAICVEDSGTGIQPENAARIFDAFFTTKPQRPGLGLAICRTIVVAHGGHISVSAGEGNGTAFRIILPAGS